MIEINLNGKKIDGWYQLGTHTQYGYSHNVCRLCRVLNLLCDLYFEWSKI